MKTSNVYSSIFTAMFLAAVGYAAVPADAELRPCVIPAPREMRLTGGECRIKKNALKIERVDSIPREGYEISITPKGVNVRCSSDTGEFYARITIDQIKRIDPKTDERILPCLEIKDRPKFAWRSVHLAESQRIFGKDAIKQMIHLASRCKYNIFHWHFVDKKGWRVDFPKYPNLARKSAKPRLCSNEPQPLFYSEADAQEIIKYAKKCHVTVVPEVEFPGHFTSVIRAFPDFACPLDGGKKRGGVMCIGNPNAVKFAEETLDWMCALFPSETIHIGGDECPRGAWKKCPRCQAFMKEKGLKSVAELQPWLTKHLADYLAKKGRRTVGWDEIAVGLSHHSAIAPETFLAPSENIISMGYNSKAGAASANRGFKTVQTPSDYWYFDYSQGVADDPFRYFGITRRTTPLEAAYGYDPYDGVNPEARKNVIGGGCCNWTMFTFTPDQLEWKMWPRAFATAEILWTHPAKENRDFSEFSARVAEHRRRLIRQHVNCAPLR